MFFPDGYGHASHASNRGHIRLDALRFDHVFQRENMGKTKVFAGQDDFPKSEAAKTAELHPVDTGICLLMNGANL